MTRSPSFSGPARAGRGGFTLIEVMLALAILVLLTGGVFGTVRAVLQATADMKETQRMRDGVYGLVNLCQQTFSTLPPSASLSWGPRSDNTGLSELTLRNASDSFSIGDTFLFGETALTVHRQANGGLVLGIEYRRIDLRSGKELADPLWLPLVHDLESVNWSFYDDQTRLWKDTPLTQAHPTLAKVSLVAMGDPAPLVHVFWLPKMAGPPAPPPALADARPEGAATQP